MSSSRSDISTSSEHLVAYSSAISRIDVSQLASCVVAIRVIADSGNTIYIAGNGGSYANAAHLVLHLREIDIPAVDLMADGAYLTAISNDHSYPEVMRKLLQTQGDQGDGLIVISGSGQSANIILALVEANARGITTIGLLSDWQGSAASLCAVSIVVSGCTEYGPIEVAHDACIHIIKEMLVSGRGIDKSLENS